MTTADPSAPADAPAPEQEHEVVREFTRLAGHTRLITAAMLLLFRSALIASLLLFWPAVTEPSWSGAILPDQLIQVMITAAMTIWCMQFLMPWQSRPIRTALLTTAIIILWTSIAALLFWDEPMAARPAHILRLAAVILAAAALATIASRYALLLLRPQDLQASIPFTPAPTPPFTRFCLSCAAPLGDADTCPTCGRATPKPDLRPALQRELTRMRSAWQSSLLGLRCLALLIGTLALAGLAQAWADQFHYGNPDPLAELILWSILGSLTGALMAFLAIHRPRLSAAIGAAIVVLLSLAAGVVLALLAEPASGSIGFPALYWQASTLASAAAATAALLTHWLLTILVTRFAPLASAQLMLGRKIDRPAPATAAPPPSPRTCEHCGYQLEGLPATRCPRCSVVGLRCPECGHAQPANALNARLLRVMYKLHTAIRILTCLAGIGMTLWLLLLWAIVARSIGGRFAHNFGWEDFLGILLASFVTVGPVRLLLLHGRPLWLISLLVALSPAAAILAGSSRASLDDFNATMWAVTVLLLPCWLLASFAAPYLWRFWLRIIYGPATATNLFQWHRSPAYRHNSPEQILSDPDQALGRELPLHCAACRTPIPTDQASACPTCIIHSTPCPACHERRGIPAIRVGLESLMHRLRCAGLALLAALAASVAVILLLADLANGASMMRHVWFPGTYGGAYLTNTIESGIFCAVAFGILGRMVMIRRSAAAAATTVAATHAVWFAVVPLAFIGGHNPQPPSRDAALLWLLVLLASGGLAFVSALLGRPLLHLALHLLPRPMRPPLFAWLTGRQTLNDVLRPESPPHPNPPLQ